MKANNAFNMFILYILPVLPAGGVFRRLGAALHDGRRAAAGSGDDCGGFRRLAVVETLEKRLETGRR